jgi:WD40 repeat protein
MAAISDHRSDFAEFQAFSPDHRYFLSQVEFGVSTIDTDTGKELRSTKANVRSGKNSLMGFTADERCYYVAKSEKLIDGFHRPGLHTFDPVSGRETLVLEDVPSGLRSADAKLGLITHGDYKNYLWDLATLNKLREVESMEGYAENAMFSPDGKILVSWHDKRDGEKVEHQKKDEPEPRADDKKLPEIGKQMDEAMQRWAARVPLMKFWDVSTGRLLSQSDIPTPVFPNGSSSFGEFSPDAKTFLFYNETQNSLALWDIPKGKEIWQQPIPNSKVRNQMKFSDDGRFLVLSGRDDIVGNTLVWGGIDVLDAATGRSAWKRPEVTHNPMGLWQGSRFSRGNRVLYYQYRWTPYPLNHVKSWFDDFAGRGHWGDYDLVVCDLATGVPVTRLRDCGYGTLSEDGQTIQAVEYTTTVDGPKLLRIGCWDLPPLRRWEIILGVPAVVGLLALAWRRWRRKVVAARSAPSVQPAASA